MSSLPRRLGAAASQFSQEVVQIVGIVTNVLRVFLFKAVQEVVQSFVGQIGGIRGASLGFVQQIVKGNVFVPGGHVAASPPSRASRSSPASAKLRRMYCLPR